MSESKSKVATESKMTVKLIVSSLSPAREKVWSEIILQAKLFVSSTSTAHDLLALLPGTLSRNISSFRLLNRSEGGEDYGIATAFAYKKLTELGFLNEGVVRFGTKDDVDCCGQLVY